jgi:hypothetical protein
MTRRRCLDCQDGRHCRHSGYIPAGMILAACRCLDCDPEPSRPGCSATPWSRTTSAAASTAASPRPSCWSAGPVSPTPACASPASTAATCPPPAAATWPTKNAPAGPATHPPARAALAPSPGGGRGAAGGTADPCHRDHPARPGVKLERPQAASSPSGHPSWPATWRPRTNELDAGACRAGWYSRRVRASAERGRVQGPGRAEADLGPWAVTPYSPRQFLAAILTTAQRFLGPLVSPQMGP